MSSALLAIETSSSFASIAVQLENKTVHREFAGGRGKLLLAEIDLLLKSVDCTASDLTGFVAGVGPGSYTGLRIACAAAQTLSWDLKIPAYGFCSFEAMALEAPNIKECHIAINAYRQELYHACYLCRESDLVVVQEPQVILQADNQQFIPNGAMFIGDVNLISNSVDCITDEFKPTATQLLKLCELRGLSSGSALEPLYLRVAR